LQDGERYTTPKEFSTLQARSLGAKGCHAFARPNVLLVDRKVKAIERLIIVKPDQIAPSEAVEVKSPPG
jgi:hypothetical protein